METLINKFYLFFYETKRTRVKVNSRSKKVRFSPLIKKIIQLITR